MSSSPSAEVVRVRGSALTAAAARARAQARERDVQLLCAITAFGALLRFGTLDSRSYWVDEAATVDLVRHSLGGMLTSVVHTESSPPAYFVLAWLWSKAFGTGEVGLRSLTALAATLTIPVAFGIARRLVSRRAALAAALLTAVSPLAVWHGQDARPYALLILLSALSVLLFVEALDAPRGWVLAGWAVASTLALATSYMSFFVVLPAAVWLLLRARGRDVFLAVTSVGLAGVALLPLALEQHSNGSASWIGRQSLPVRVVEVPAQFLVGYQPPLQRTSAVVAGLLVLIGLSLLARRAGPDEQRGAKIAALIGAIALAGPLLLAFGGFDGLITRAVTGAWVPLVVVVASGFTARRAGRVGLLSLTAVCALSLAIVVSTAGEPKFEREDWRGAASAIGQVADRAIVLSPENGSLPVLLYRPNARELKSGSVATREIVLVAFGPEYRKIGHRPEPPRPATVGPPARGFREVQRIDNSTFTLIRFRSPTPVVVRPALAGRGFGSPARAVLVEQAGRR